MSYVCFKLECGTEEGEYWCTYICVLACRPIICHRQV